MIPYSIPNYLIYIPYSRVNWENYTLHSGTYLESPYYMAVPAPPPPPTSDVVHRFITTALFRAAKR